MYFSDARIVAPGINGAPPLARSGEGALALSCRMPHGHDQTSEEFSVFHFFLIFSDLRRPQVAVFPTCARVSAQCCCRGWTPTQPVVPQSRRSAPGACRTSLTNHHRRRVQSAVLDDRTGELLGTLRQSLSATEMWYWLRQHVRAHQGLHWQVPHIATKPS